MAPSSSAEKAARPTLSPGVKWPSACVIASLAAASFVLPPAIGSSIDPETSTRNSTSARLRTSGNASCEARMTRALGKGRAPVWSVMQLADLGHERVELAVEVAVSGLAHDLLALLRRGEPEEVGAGGGLGLVDPRAVEHDRGVVGRVVAVARVDRHELLLGRVALHAGDAVAAGDAAVVVPDGLLVDDHGGEEVGDRARILGLARMPEEVLGRRHVVARRELVLRAPRR